MANIIATITARIEEYRKDNKNPCKNYATEAAADKALAKIAKSAAVYFDKNGDFNARPANYIVFYIEAWGRWVGAVDLTGLLARESTTGGYVGFCAEKGFYTY